MKQVFVVKMKNDINGNPRFAIDTSYYPECGNLGKPKRNANWIRIFNSYNVEKTLKDCFNEPIEICIISGLEC